MITPRQCRAARGLLGYTQADLAKKAGMSKTGLNNFESGKSSMKSTTQKALKKALEDSGIDFTKGEGVRLRTNETILLQGNGSAEALYEHILENAQDSLSVYHNNVEEIESVLSRLESVLPRIILSTHEQKSFGSRSNIRFLEKTSANIGNPKFIYGNFVAMVMAEGQTIVIVVSEDTAEAELSQFDIVWHSLDDNNAKNVA